ncbi:MAG: energy-coupling factor ABC transporter ATP-binding protein [Chloroflexi bacterium]|nr:energy-coupling factor ABC transporter ATP-binding protein [Chloroflexota bacterium]
MIHLSNLFYTYPDGREALHDVHLDVQAGEKLALVGPNGAGKSTLLMHLNGTLRGRGEVLVAGLPVSDKTARAVRTCVGLVFQDPDDQLFSPLVLDDVAFGPLHLGLPKQEVYERVTGALAAVGMSGYESYMPHHLSLGERKRIAVATVLAMEPQVLALDEPSAGLDPRARRNLIHLLRSLPQTMVVASHDMRLVWDLCSRTVILDGGRIAADGPTDELLLDTSLMEAHGLETPWAVESDRPGRALRPDDIETY